MTGFTDHITSQAALMQRAKAKKPLHIAYGDMNNFKSINDTYGHSVGDEALKFVAQILHKTTRKIDVVARLIRDSLPWQHRSKGPKRGLFPTSASS